ncbi:hypothetical protein ACFE04_023941 [Oxalis oulophora]
MANSNPPAFTMSSGFSKQKASTVEDLKSNHHNPSCSDADGPVAIFWDIENCPVPGDVRAQDVAGNIRMALRVHPVIKGAVTTFSAYGDFNAFPRRLREGCQRTGVRLIDVPNGRKDAADKAILVDMFLFALDNQPPSSIMLISGDVDFAPALHILGQRGYTIILVIPSTTGVSSALCNAGKFVWDWLSVARGEGFVPPPKAFVPPRVGLTEIAGYFAGCHMNDNIDGQYEEEAIVYRGVSQNLYDSRDCCIKSESFSDYANTTLNRACFPATSRSQSFPTCLNEDEQSNSLLWAPPGDVNGLKAQFVMLLELFGGCLPFLRISSEYQKLFGRPLYVSEFGANKLVFLLNKMNDSIAIDGKGHKRSVYLRNFKAGPSAPPLTSTTRKEKKGKGSQYEVVNNNNEFGQSYEFSDGKRVAIEENDEKRNPREAGNDHILERFKFELQDILVSYSCGIFLGCLEEIYQQRYKRPLDYRSFGVGKLEELLDKVRDVVELHEEPVSKRKFVIAVSG